MRNIACRFIVACMAVANACFVLASVCFIEVALGQEARAQGKQYVFKPGSRQAVEVPAGQAYGPGAYGAQGSFTGGSRQGGMMMHRGGMTVGGVGSMNSASSASVTSGARRTYSRPGVPRTGTTKSAEAKSINFKDYVMSGGIKREYLVHLPPTYSRSTPLPLILVFHGLHMQAETMIAATGFNGMSNRDNFIVVYCQASPSGEWQDGMKNMTVNDVAYVDDVLEALGKKVAYDRHRVYATGVSNGGFFVQLLAASMPEKIAAVCVVSSTVMEQAVAHFKTATPVPIMFFLGTDDPLLDWGDGKTRGGAALAKKLGSDLGGITPEWSNIARYGGWWNVNDMISFWAEHNGAGNTPTTTYEPDRDPSDGQKVKKQSYGSRGREVIAYIIEGGGHTWPGTLYLPGMKGRPCQDVDASAEMWKFFRQQSR